MKFLYLPFFSVILSGNGIAQDAQALFKEGKKLKEEKKSEEAISKFQEAVNLKQDYTEARYELAWCQNDTKRYYSAIDNLSKVKKAWPAVPKVWFELGYAFENSNQTDSAVNSYLQCLFYKSDYAGAYKQLGYIEYNRDNYQVAIHYLKRYIDLKTTGVTEYLVWYRKGFCENNLKLYEEAIRSLLKAEELEKKYINIYLELGYAHSKLKKNDEAIAWFNKAKSLDPKSHIAYNGIAEVFRDNIKDFDKAIELYKETLKVKPDERKACYGIGYCLNAKQQYSNAIAYLRKAIEMEDNYVAAYIELGYALFKNGQNSEARQKLEKALSLNPENVNAHYYIILLYINEKNKIKAQEYVNKLRPLNAKYADELQLKINVL